jgi:hypothetical protein
MALVAGALRKAPVSGEAARGYLRSNYVDPEETAR